jgi:thiazole synthase ThiGH ThiG subunit
LYSDGTEHRLDLETAKAVITISKTNALVMNVPRQPRTGGLPFQELLDSFFDLSRVVPLLNTSQATNAQDAMEMIERARFDEESGGPFDRPALFKLEILVRRSTSGSEQLEALNDQTLLCLEQLDQETRSRTIPILSPDADDVRTAIEHHLCPAVRVLCGRIGHHTGVLKPELVSSAISAARGKPVILEGGLAETEHIRASAALGASAVLMNSVFRNSLDPIGAARRFREAADSALWLAS